MVPRLQEIDAVAADQIDDAVLLGKAAGPDAGGKVFQRFRLADPGKGIAQNRFHDDQGAQGNSSFRGQPMAQVSMNSDWKTASRRGCFPDPALSFFSKTDSLFQRFQCLRFFRPRLGACQGLKQASGILR